MSEDTPRPPVARTVGLIAAELLVPVHRVQYIIRTRNIQPQCVAGNLKIFTKDDVARIRHELNAIDARKGGAR